MVKAKDVLKQHHSRPALVAQVEEVLRTSQFNDMTTMSVSPYCAWCKQWGKKSAKFCALCSWEIHPVPISEQSYAAIEAQPPWQSAQSWDSSGRVPSPRQRNQSPRRTGKGRDKGKGKGKGKDVGKDGKQGKGNPSQPPGIVPPSLPALPPPPKVPPLPKASPSPPPSDAAASDAQVKLDALLTTLRSSKDALPPEIAHLVGESELAASQQQSKALHKAINAQDAARKELHKVQNARRAYLASWSSYVGQLQTLLATQMEEQDQALQDFQKHEQRWQKQLKEASKTLAALSRGKGDTADKDGPATVNLTSGSDMDEDSEDSKQDPWAALDQAQKLRDGQQELAAALSRAREKAEIAAKQAKRDSSRSPRRQRDRETEEAKDSKDSKEMDAKHELPLNALT